MSTVHSRPQLSPSELRCSPHTTYYTNFFVLRTAVTIDGQAAEIGFSENKQLTLNWCYPSTEFMSITFHTISSQVEAVLKKYGVSHISNFWLGEVLFLQEVQRKVGLLFSARLREGQTSTASASPVSHGFPVEVDTDLFLVLPDAEDKMRAVSLENCSSCLALWKESEKFDFGALFKSFKQGGATVKGELSVNVLVLELSDVVEWFTFGLFLGVPTSDLLRIERERPFSITECLSHMLDWWMKNGEQLTWSAVVRALFGIRRRGLAKKIAVKYAVPWEAQMAVSTATDTHPTHMTVAGSQTVPVQLQANIQQVYSSLEERDEELTEINESLPVAKKRKMVARRKHTQVKKQLTVAKTSKKRLVVKRDAVRRQLEVKEGELKFLKQLQEMEKKRNDELQAIIVNKETEIVELRKQLIGKENELSQAREEIRKLTKQLQQTTVELVKKSTQVREMERARGDIETERSRVDMMVMQLCAKNERLQSQLERVTFTELDTLKQAVQEKEEEIARLSSQLEVKETEEQKLLVQVERQSQQEEDELVQLTAEVCELRSHLMEAEDGRMRAEVELKDLKSRRNVVNQPAPENCKAVGHGIQFGETNQTAEFQVHLIDANGELCVERQEVRAELKSLVDSHITQAEVSHQTRSVGNYSVSYKPSIRGRHELSVLVNDVAFRGSPFRVYVQQPPRLMGRPVRVIKGLNRPWRATMSSSGQLIVTEYGGHMISVFDGQGKLVHRIDSLERCYSKVELYPRGVAIDNSGTMYVCDGIAHNLFKVSSTGKMLRSVGGKGSGHRQFDRPDGIALRDNRLYICDCNNHRIQILSCDLNFISSFGSRGRGKGEFIGPRDIAFDQEGNMYVVEEGNHRVQVFSPSGTFLRIFGKRGSGSGKLSGPWGIHVDHNIVYITEHANYRISIFTTLGEFIRSFSRRGCEKGEFREPVGITMDCDGFLYVCDYGNNCIQMF